MQLRGVKKELQIIWCTSESWDSYLFDVMTTHNDWWIYTTCPLFWALTGWSLNKKCHWHYKESYGPLGGRSEGSITQLHTAQIRTNMLFKWQQRAGLSPPPPQGNGRKKKRSATCQYKGKENRCLSNLRLNGVRLQIVHSPFHPISRFVTHIV